MSKKDLGGYCVICGKKMRRRGMFSVCKSCMEKGY